MALQKTTEKKLSEIFNFLTNQGENDVARLVTEILRAECKVKRGTKFSLYDFVDKTGRRQYEGVHYEDGKQIATNGGQLIVLKEEYDPELEGKTIDRKGEEVEHLFPKYGAVLPKSLDGYEAHKIEPETFYSWIDERRAAYKLTNNGKNIKWDGGWFVKVGPCLFKAERFNMIIKAGKALGSLTLYTKTNDMAAVIKTDKGIFISMPWYETNSDDVLVLA